MSKFRKVAETQGVPDYIEKQFIPEAEVQNDVYSNLRQSAKRHKFVISQESSDTQRSAPKQPKEWERVTTAEVYQQPRMTPNDDAMSNLNAYDSSARAIRRAGYDTDEGDNARAGVFNWGTDADVTTALIRGASIFDTDLDDIRDSLVEENETRISTFVTEQEKRRQLEAKHVAWEQQQLNALRPLTIASSRANPIIRTGMENLSASSFGTYDYNSIEQREKQRFEMAEAKREKKMAISRVGKTQEEQRQQWEDDLDPYASTYQTYQNDWLDNFGD